MKSKWILNVVTAAAVAFVAQAERPDAEDGGYRVAAGGVNWWIWMDDGLRSVSMDNGQLSLSGALTVPIGDLGITGNLWIGDDAFKNQRNLTEITIPETANGVSVVGIEGDAFEFCTSLTTINLPSTVRWVDDDAFEGCSALTTITAPEALLPQIKIAVKAARLKNVSVNGVSLSSSTTPSGKTTADFPAVYNKAQTLMGKVTDADGNVEGIVQVKVGKANRNGEVRVSAKMTALNGKSYTASGEKMIVGSDGAGSCMMLFKKLALEVPLDFSVANGVCTFSGSDAEMSIESGDVGGAWQNSTATVEVGIDDTSMFTGEVLTGILPSSVSATASGGKWTFAKGTSVKYKKVKDKSTGTVSYELQGMDGANPSSMKLTYTPKKGTFKGSFKVYEIQTTGAKKKLKKYSVKVSGVVVDGVGYGTATCKKPAAEWAVTVK